MLTFSLQLSAHAVLRIVLRARRLVDLLIEVPPVGLRDVRLQAQEHRVPGRDELLGRASGDYIN